MAGPIIRRRDNIATANGTTSPACSFASLPAAGSAILVAWASWHTSSTTYTHSSVSDNQGGTYTQIGTTQTFNSNTGSAVCRLSLWKRDNISAPSGTFTVTGTASTACDSRFAIVEYVGVATSTLDQTNQTANTTGTALSTTLTTTTNAQDMIVGAASVGTGAAAATLVPDPTNLPWLVRENLDDSASQSLQVVERWVGATGAYTGSWTTASGSSAAIVAAIKGDTWAGPYPVGAGTAVYTATNGATLTPTLPTGWAADDIHILIAHRSDNTAMTSLANWTQISAANNTTGQRVEVWARRAVGGDGNPTITFGTSTVVRGARIIGIRGVDTGLTLSSIQLSRSNNAASATVTFATLTPTPANTLILALYAYEDDPTQATPLSLGNGLAISTSALGNDMALGWGAVGWPSASSATGAQTSTVSGGTFANSPNVGILIALPPASASGPVESAAGVSAGVSVASGTLTATVKPAGASAGASTASGTLTATVPVAGAAAGTSTAAGALVATVPVAGTTAGTSTASAAATVETLVPVAGAVAATGTATGALAATVPASGASAGTSTVGGALSGAVSVAGASAVTSTATGALAAAVSAAGSSAGLSTAAGTTTATVPLAGASAGVSTIGGDLTEQASGQEAAAGTAAGTSTVAGTLTATVALAGGAGAVSTAIGTATVTGQAAATPLAGYARLRLYRSISTLGAGAASEATISGTRSGTAVLDAPGGRGTIRQYSARAEVEG